MSVLPASRFRSAIIVAACALFTLASGCSALRIGYGSAPDLVYWWLDGYADFDAAQTVRARAAIAQWFGWHRRAQLPEYASLLARAQVEVLADTTPARVCEWQAEIVKRGRSAFERIAPDAAELVPTLTPQQFQHIEHRYAKNNDAYRDEFLQSNPRERVRTNVKRAVDRAETLYGSLDDAQRERIAEAMARSPFDPDAWLAERLQRQQDLLQMLRKLVADGAGRDRVQAALRAYVERFVVSPREPYRRYAERLTEFNCGFAAALHNGTSAAQRRVAVQRLAGWEGDLRAIAATTESAAP